MSSIWDFGFRIWDLAVHRRRGIGLAVVAMVGAMFLLASRPPVDPSTVHAGELPDAGHQIFSSSASPINDLLPPGMIHSFSNATPINFPVGAATGTPYPSSVTVSGIPNELAKVTVTLRLMNHTFTSDIDILLVGPQGQTAIILSDIGGGTDLINTTITLDDESTVFPTVGPLIDGAIYHPNNGSTGGVPDPFPAPAPSPIKNNSDLSVFNGTDPNGEWRLFVMDDVPTLDGGAISGGWTLTVTSAFSGQNANSIAIPESGVASPYPSEITLADHVSPVSQVRVSLVNFSHTSPDDVDILLVGPGGRSVPLMSDVGGTNPISNVNLIFDDTAANGLQDNAPIVSGSYRPTDFEPGDVYPLPAPAGAPSGRTLASLNGSPPDGAWKLFVVDDSGNNVGSVTGGWNILVRTSDSTISFQGTLPATPYPSQITVSGLPGNTTRATVSIQNFSHTAPDDVDILLVGPDGRKIVLMSDVGGGSEAAGLNLTLDDLAPGPLPDSSSLTSGSYTPTDYEPGEIFPAPAPTGPPGGSTLNGVFYGGLPNGIWRLYVVNDSGAGYGSIAGAWSVSLQTSTSACLVSITPGVQAFPVSGGTGSFSIGQPNGCSWTASTTDSFITITSGDSGGGNGSVSFSVAPNAGPPRTGTITVSNSVTTRSFQVQQAAGCPFSVSQSTANFPSGGGAGNVGVTAGGGCSWVGSTAASWIQITSQPQSGNGTLTFTVQPNTGRAARSATIDVGAHVVTVNQAALKSIPYDFDGDARSDISIFRPSSSQWWIAQSTQPGTATAQTFGLATDMTVPADYDGDLKADIAVYRDGVWYALLSSNGTVSIANWGNSTDIPVPADYSGDGSAELAVFRPSTGSWWILNSNGTFSSTAFGIEGDTPTPGDYDGDGKTDLSIYRPGSTGTWWILNSSNGIATQHTFGIQGDVPVPGDFDGDGRDNVALYRPSTGYWYRSLNAAQNYEAVQWGIGGDRPVLGDYDGDGRADPAVVRFGSDVVWYVLGSASGSQAVAFGAAGDRVVAEAR